MSTTKKFEVGDKVRLTAKGIEYVEHDMKRELTDDEKIGVIVADPHGFGKPVFTYTRLLVEPGTGNYDWPFEDDEIEPLTEEASD